MCFLIMFCYICPLLRYTYTIMLCIVYTSHCIALGSLPMTQRSHCRQYRRFIFYFFAIACHAMSCRPPAAVGQQQNIGQNRSFAHLFETARFFARHTCVPGWPSFVSIVLMHCLSLFLWYFVSWSSIQKHNTHTHTATMKRSRKRKTEKLHSKKKKRG